MNSLLSLLFLSLIVAACEKKPEKKELQIAPVSAEETRAILFHLRSGHPEEEVIAEGDSCKSFQAGLPANFIKGFVVVPEDYNNPRARQIKVFYYGRLEDG